MFHRSQTPDAKRKRSNWFQRVSLLVGFNLVCVAAFINGESVAELTWQLQNRGVITSGTVVKVHNYHVARIGWPTVAFKVNGETYMFEVHTNLQTYQVGERVQVRYDPTDPHIAQIDNNDRWAYPIIWMSVGILFALFFNLLVVWALQQQRKLSRMRTSSFQQVRE